MNNLMLGGLYGLIAQIGTFLQLQGNVKYDWYSKHPVILLLCSIPLSWLYIQSVKHLVLAFDGQIWPSRIIGFGIGIIVFSIMGYLLFREPITLKTGISILLAIGIILTQLIIK
jgi:multidrug transporter EmrE-like cation transporter